jgi:hypothetical protein
LFLYFDFDRFCFFGSWFDRFCFFGSWQRNVKYAVLAGGVYLGGVNVVRQIQVAPEATVGPVEKIVAFFLLLFFMFFSPLMVRRRVDCRGPEMSGRGAFWR